MVAGSARRTGAAEPPSGSEGGLSGDRASVEALVESLVLHAFGKAKIPYFQENFHEIYVRLSVQLWDRVQEEGLQVHAKTEHLHKDVYKSLCRKWRRPAVVMSVLLLDDRSVQYSVVSVIIEHLRTAAKRGAVSKCLSSVVDAICWPCRRPARVQKQ